MDYSPPSSAVRYNAEEEMARLLQHLQTTREIHLREQEAERKGKIQQLKQEVFLRKQREGKFSLDPHRRPPWRVGDRHVLANFDPAPPILPAGDISPTALLRTKHLLPRTYQSPEIPFISTAHKSLEFGRADPKKVFSKSAIEMLKVREEEFDREVDRRRRGELLRKRVVFEKKWGATDAGGKYFSVPHCDKYYLFEHPLKAHPSQSKPFLRTKRAGDLFSK